ncbi:MAG: DUF6157 family protein [Coriobacteriaceae bacterium]|jgi:hypothetical protein|nr:DUF6157 family protein [Coriobacteriaceae bacterium]
MRQHTTNYADAFIEAAEDCPAHTAEAPPLKEPKSAARHEYEMLQGNPYLYTSDDVAYETKGRPKGISREEFFSKGQPCLRASALTKRYGWGIHSDGDGRIALFAKGSPDYDRLAADGHLRHLKALSNNKGTAS